MAKNLEEVLKAAGNPVEHAAQFADRRLRLSGGAVRVLELARRAGGLARRPRCCSTSRTTWSSMYVKGPDALKLLHAPGASTASPTSRSNRAKQFVPVQLRRLRHRRRHPVPPRREPAWCSSAARRRRTGSSSTPRPAATTSRSRRTTARPATPKGKAVNRTNYRFQIQGPNARKVIEKLNGGPVPDIKFFHMDDDQDRRPQGARAAPRHGRRAGPRDLGPVRGARGDPRRDRRGRRGVRPAAGRRRAPTPPTRSNRAGSPRRCPPSTPARR